jgi:hypothetical protein
MEFFLFICICVYVVLQSTTDGVLTGSLIDWKHHTQLLASLYRSLLHRLAVLVAVLTALLGNGFQRFRVSSFRLQRLLYLLVGTFQLQLPS